MEKECLRCAFVYIGRRRPVSVEVMNEYNDIVLSFYPSRAAPLAWLKDQFRLIAGNHHVYGRVTWDDGWRKSSC